LKGIPQRTQQKMHRPLAPAARGPAVRHAARAAAPPRGATAVRKSRRRAHVLAAVGGERLAGQEQNNAVPLGQLRTSEVRPRIAASAPRRALTSRRPRPPRLPGVPGGGQPAFGKRPAPY